MSHYLRKHRKWIMWILAITIIPAFVFWGGYRGSGSDHERAQNGDTVVASVGGMPITVMEYRRALDEQLQQMRRGSDDATYKDLAATGAADKILENLITRALFTQAVSKDPVTLDRKFLETQIKKDPAFKDDKGNFDIAKWNAWIDESKKRGLDWNAQYAQITDMVRQQLFVKQVSASARVLDSDVKKQFEEDNTKLKVKYVNIDPKVEPTEDQIKKHYEANKEKYDLPEQRVAEFAAVSLVAPKPALADEIVARARKGEDFAELAKKYSEAANKESGGELEWMSQTLTEPAYREPLFKLGVNDVSDPIEGTAGYYIYKVEQERTNETTKLREIKAREIQLHPKLADAELAKRTEEADKIAAKARETKDLKAAAAAANLDVKTTSKFSADTMTIENVAPDDARAFRVALSKLGKGEISEVIKAPRNLYIATITDIIPAVPQPLDAVRDKVIADTIAEIKRSPEHAEKIAKLAQDIQAKAHSLRDIQTMFPELKAEIGETKEFSAKDFDYTSGLFWNPREIYQAVGADAPGAFAGPIRDMIGRIYFIELVSKTPPSEAAWKEQFPKDEKDIRKNLRMAKENERLEDFLKDLRASAKTPIQTNMQVVSEILGLNAKDENGAEGAGDATEAEQPATKTEQTAAEADVPTTKLPEAAPAESKPAAAPEAPAADKPAESATPPAPAPETKPAETAPAPEAPKAQ